MRRVLLFVFFMFLIFSLKAQEQVVWIGLAPKFGYGTGYFYNQTAFFSDDKVEIAPFSPAMSYGGRLSLGFAGGALSISAEVMKNDFSQNFLIYDTAGQANAFQAKLSSFSYGLMFKAYSETGFYVEFGPQLNSVLGAKLNLQEITGHFSNRFFTGTFGLGFMPLISQFFEISLGLRGIASFGSIMADNYFLYSQSPNYSVNMGNNTLLLSVMPMIDVNFVFAKMGRASCGKFRIMLNSSGTRKVRIRR